MKHSVVLSKILTSLVLIALVLATLPVSPARAATQTIGGTAAAGNLRISVLDDGAMAIEQWNGSAWLNNIFGVVAKGTTLCVATTRYDMGGESTWSPTASWIPIGLRTNNAATYVSNTGGAAGSGAITTTWTAGGMNIVQTTSYTDGNQYYTLSWAITNTSGDPINDLRLFNGQDTLLAGSDRGSGWWDATLGTYGSVGVTHPTSGQQMWLQPVSEAPFNYSSQYYRLSRIEASGCALSGAIDPASSTDNGYAMEFRRATLANGATWTVTVEEHFTPSTPLPPTLVSLTPNHGPVTGGTDVTINGTNLTSGTFTFGGTAATCTVNNDGTQAICTTPAHVAGLVNVAVTTAGGTATLPSSYTFDPTPKVLPATGFAPGRVTFLPEQPVSKAYEGTDLVLEIPALNQKINIVGVPQSEKSWDVSWLDNNAGWLEGSAFPTWDGNTVLTGHVWDALNRPGPFASLKSLKYGDQILIHAFGMTYTYEVRESKSYWAKTAASKVFRHEEKAWVTLVTCETYNSLADDYFFRRVVRAVLVSVK